MDGYGKPTPDEIIDDLKTELEEAKEKVTTFEIIQRMNRIYAEENIKLRAENLRWKTAWYQLKEEKK